MSSHTRPFSTSLSIAALLGVTGCGAAPDGETDGSIGETQSAIQVCPGGPTVPGIDVSYYQGGIDWAAVAGSGMTFAITRINDGDFMDPYFGPNWDAIKAVGMVRGAYQFYEPTMDPAYQANIVVGAVGQLGPGDLPVTLDVEWTSGTPNAGAIQTWVDIVTQGTGKRPMIYTAAGYWNQYFGGEFANIDLWVANWDISCPNLPSSWNNWVFWQPGGGPVAGIGGNVDQDVFNGSLDDLKMLANANSSQNCAASGAGACAHFGCGCADDQCNGGFCPGTGCTAQHTNDCANFGCGCVDGECGGGYCPGTGCTAKETLDCQGFGCGCVDHQCAGGVCDGGGCTAKETMDCQAFGCGCADHQCAGGACEGTGCTGKQTTDCQAQGDGCSMGTCVPGESDPGGGDNSPARPEQDPGSAGAGDGLSSNGAAPEGGDDSGVSGGCAVAARGGGDAGFTELALLAVAALALRGRRRRDQAARAA